MKTIKNRKKNFNIKSRTKKIGGTKIIMKNLQKLSDQMEKLNKNTNNDRCKKLEIILNFLHKYNILNNKDFKYFKENSDLLCKNLYFFSQVLKKILDINLNQDINKELKIEQMMKIEGLDKKSIYDRESASEVISIFDEMLDKKQSGGGISDVIVGVVASKSDRIDGFDFLLAILALVPFLGIFFEMGLFGKQICGGRIKFAVLIFLGLLRLVPFIGFIPYFFGWTFFKYIYIAAVAAQQSTCVDNPEACKEAPPRDPCNNCK